jgi:hypothetical protein
MSISYAAIRAAALDKTSATALGKGQGLKSWNNQEQVWLGRGITDVPV